MEEYLKKSDVMAAWATSSENYTPLLPLLEALPTTQIPDPSPAPGAQDSNHREILGSSLKLEVGKLYRTRNGRKAFISAIYGDTVYGAIYNTNYISSWYSDGFYEKNTISFNDLIAEWQDEPDKAQPNKLREMIDALNWMGFNELKPILREIVSLLENRRG